MSKLFGTDGIRGRVGVDPITPSFAFRIGGAAARCFSLNETDQVLIGCDTRESSRELSQALANGLSTQGVITRWLGVMPTPAISYATKTTDAALGIAVTASHNPYTDNGFKFFDQCGEKLTVESELAFTQAIQVFTHSGNIRPSELVEQPTLRRSYVEFCAASLDVDLARFRRLHLILDCANGALFQIAQEVFGSLTKNVEFMFVTPDGKNINERCGATAPGALQKRVVETHADLGIALDGDGDRIVVTNRRGRLLDGDKLLYLLARRFHEIGRLRGGVVGTVMTNMALNQALDALGIPLIRTDVGDRNVRTKMRELGWNIGGETSGHLILSDISSTGDGLLVALQIVTTILTAPDSWSSLNDELKLATQVHGKVDVNEPTSFARREDVKFVISQLESDAKSNQRIVTRPSGTESVYRVMVEGFDEKAITKSCNTLVDVLQKLANE